MATEAVPPETTPELRNLGLEVVRDNWGWYLALGIVLIVLGTIALSYSCLVTLTAAAMIFYGVLLLVGGVLEIVHSFWRKQWGGFFLDLISGVLYVAVGFLMVSKPVTAGVALTLLIAMFLIFAGLFRIITALTVQFQNWIWLLLSGVASLLLGIFIWSEWPGSGFFFIGLFIAIELILNGWSLVMLALMARNIPQNQSPSEPATAGETPAA